MVEFSFDTKCDLSHFLKTKLRCRARAIIKVMDHLDLAPKVADNGVSFSSMARVQIMSLTASLEGALPSTTR